ncbi:MAG TPA: hypothetical protein VFQ53_38035 [Kofleriaceae bacterium]|nr:hypothetical protein [Kofleriaceae bacterium]
MRRLGVALVMLAECGGGDGGTEPQVTVSTKFQITDVRGTGPSPLDQLANQTIDITVTLDAVGVARNETATCKRLGLYVTEAGRAARGATATIVQDQIFEKLVGWEADLELCDDPALSTFALQSDVNELNLIFGCATVPASANVRDADGLPVMSSFTASACEATILDVVNNRDLGASGFTMQVVTGPAHVP